jgi:tetratricopeptide (TPR) repeat protein
MKHGGLLTLVFVGLLLGSALEPSGVLASPAAQSEQEIEEAMRVFNRGKVLHQERQYREAIKEYLASLELDDQNPFVFNALGWRTPPCRIRACFEGLQPGVALNPVYGRLQHRDDPRRAGREGEAFEAFSRAVRNPNYTTPEKALYNMGNLYLEDGNLELAEMHFRRAVEKQPKFALGHRGLAKVYLKMNQTDLAVSQFQKAVEIAPEDSESLFQLAKIHEEKGELDQAKGLYRRVVEIDRVSTFGKMALDRLTALKES